MRGRGRDGQDSVDRLVFHEVRGGTGVTVVSPAVLVSRERCGALKFFGTREDQHRGCLCLPKYDD